MRGILERHEFKELRTGFTILNKKSSSFFFQQFLSFFSITILALGVCLHAAVTSHSTAWTLYLNGQLENREDLNTTPQFSSIQHAGTTALASTGSPSGYFGSAIDEVSIWNYAGNQQDIYSTINSEINRSHTKLVARSGMNERTDTDSINSSLTPGAPFDIIMDPPADPTNASATALSYLEVQLTWDDNSDNEINFEIDRSTTGSVGSFSLLATLTENTTSYNDQNLDPQQQYCYRVRSVNAAGNSNYTNTACATTPAAGDYALDFVPNSYITFGNPLELGLSEFTIECWFRREGEGTPTSTGPGGIESAIPLVTKGRAETDGDNRDMNYFLGIDDVSDVLAADFEEGSGGTHPGLNHPVYGTTVITNGTWCHAAVTYDGNKWQLFLNGSLETELNIGRPTQSASIQCAAIASALNSASTPDGFFDGAIDEVRIWNKARSQAEIQGTLNSEINYPQANLVARWGLNEGSGSIVHSNAGTAVNGTAIDTGWSWISPGAPFDINIAPNQPVVVEPSDGASGLSRSPTLTIMVSDPESKNMRVTFYGRALSSASPDFTLIGLPDTQYYTSNKHGGSPDIFEAQTQWIVDNKTKFNIAYVAHLGDCVDEGDTNEGPWQAADAAMELIENPATTGLRDGIPFAIAVGNNDQLPYGDPTGTTTYYNEYFGETRFNGRGYYGGHYGSNNDNHYSLFSAGGMDFIVIDLEYGANQDTSVLSWADNLLQTYSTRRAIIVSHRIISNLGSFTGEGAAYYNSFKDNSNVFLMLCAHNSGEGRRTDTYNGNSIHTVLADYQSRSNGGNGWLRIFEFSPADNEIRVQTYSPWLDQWETDEDSQFTLNYDMQDDNFEVISTNTNVASGASTSIVWPNLTLGTTYEWYVTINDGNSTISSPTYSFTVGEVLNAIARGNGSVRSNPEKVAYETDEMVELTAVPSSGSKFREWQGDLSGTVNPQTITMNSNKIIYAVFENEVITQFHLYANYPNPFNSGTTIKFDVPENIPGHQKIKLIIYNTLGQEVRNLFDGTVDGGVHEIYWDGRDEGNAQLASGLYFVRLKTNSYEKTMKIMLIR
jgi:hypothetical protein